MLKIGQWRPVEIVYTWLGKMGVAMSLPNRLDALERHLHKLGTQLERRLGAIDVQLADHHQHLLAILQNQERIMSAISDYAAANKEAFAAIATSLDGVEGDLQRLADLINEMQNNPGPISPADQALLDEAQTLSKGLVERVAAIDTKNPPPAPPSL